MRLAILTQYFSPEVGAPQARLAALARGFRRRGHDVTVLAAMPNYPTGRILHGYGGAFLREEMDGVRVFRSWIYPTQRTDLVRRLSSYLSFTVSSAVSGAAFLEPPDFLLVESPPLFLGMAGMLLSRLKRSRMIFNVSDLWPESAVRLGVVRSGSVGHRLSARLEAACYRTAWLVTGQTRAIVEDITHRFPECPAYHLPNGVDCGLFAPTHATATARAALGAPDACTVLYAGLHGLAQALEQVVEAAETIGAGAGLDFVFVGDGPTRAALEQRARAGGLRHVRFDGPRPHREIPALTAAADVLVVSLHHALADAVPSKLYEALASGRPIVLIAGGDAAAIVERNDAGIVVAPGDRAGLVHALQSLARDPARRERLGANGRAAAVRLFDRTRIVDAFVDLLENGLPRPRTNVPPVGAPAHQPAPDEGPA